MSTLGPSSVLIMECPDFQVYALETAAIGMCHRILNGLARLSSHDTIKQTLCHIRVIPLVWQ